VPSSKIYVEQLSARASAVFTSLAEVTPFLERPPWILPAFVVSREERNADRGVLCIMRPTTIGKAGQQRSWKNPCVLYALCALTLQVASFRVQAADSIPDWIQMLRSTDYPVYQSGIAQLQNAGAEAVPELIEALESKDWDLHNGAVETLARIGRPAVPLLTQEAKAGRLAAVEALAELGPEAVDALPVLREWVVSNSSGLGVAATRALAAIGNAGVPALVAGLKQTDGKVRYECANTLGWVGPPAQEAVPHLVALLWADPEFEEIATLSLRRIGYESKQVAAQLATYLTSTDARVRKGAVLGLSAAREPDKFAIRQIIDVARNDPDPQVRSAALTSLAWMAPANEEVARTLVAAMAKEREYGLIFDAANALGFLDAASHVLPDLIDLLNNRSADTRSVAAFVLGTRGAEAQPAIPMLRALLGDPNSNVRFQAAWALARLGPAAKDAAPDIAVALKDQRISVFVAAPSPFGARKYGSRGGLHPDQPAQICTVSRASAQGRGSAPSVSAVRDSVVLDRESDPRAGRLRPGSSGVDPAHQQPDGG
jgi:HEAT repeat protein